MYCGTCIHDNTLAAELKRQGVDVALVPTYTPLRTDEQDVSIDRIFYGGINVFLQQKWSLFRHTPRLFDRPLDHPGLLKFLSRFSASTSAGDLGELTVSVLGGEQGHQKKELERLVHWLRDEFKPDLVQLTNSMFVGMARQLKEELGVPVICALQGEDIFLQGLIEPYKERALATLRERAQDADAFIAPSYYYRDFMASYMAVDPEKIHVVHLGLHLQGHGEKARVEGDPPRIGYLARICPEKGFHLLVEAFRILSDELGHGALHLDVAGYLGGRDRPYYADQVQKIIDWGLEDFFSYRGEVDRAQKADFLSGLHLLCVPTVYAEPKGLFVLEALANGTPVVLPAHGSFPELVAATGGGILVEPQSPVALAEGMGQLLADDARRQELGRTGKERVQRDFSDAVNAEATLEVYRRFVEV